MSSNAVPEVVFQNVQKKGFIKLSRPKALNALNLSMIKEIYPRLKAWQSENLFVVISGEGDKAFCAGGDVRAVAEAGKKGEPLARNFFSEEYKLNYLIATYQIPYVALIHGITMGGGVGLSVHGTYRVATEKTVFAMPETAIGLFPDVGGTYFLPRLRGHLGMYLALTGFRLTGLDVLKAGIATHFCDGIELKNLTRDLANIADVSDLPSVLEKYTNEATKGKQHEFVLSPVLDKINNTFNGRSIEEILKSLEEDGSEWAIRQREILNKMSPTALKVTLKALTLGARLDLKHCLEMEYRIATNCLKNHDFYEGVRAVLVDRDNNPNWKPSSIGNVSEDLVDAHFNPSSAEHEELSL